MDVGRRSGALPETILARTSPIAATGIEPSEGFLQKARESINNDRVDFKSSNTLSMPVKDAEADVSVARLVLNFVPDKEAALQEFRRVVQPGGTMPHMYGIIRARCSSCVIFGTRSPNCLPLPIS